MAQSNPRQHHYVPKFILENFTNEDGKLWAVDRPAQNIFQVTPHNLFKERDLYVSYHISPEAQYDVDYATREREISKREGLAAPITKKIIASVRQQRTPELSDEDVKIFKAFILDVYRRTPSMLDKITADFSDDYYQAAGKTADEAGDSLPLKEAFYQDPSIMKHANYAKQNIKSKFATGNHPLLHYKDEKTMRDSGLHIINMLNQKRSFVISDQAFSIKQYGIPRPALLPIASDTAVCLIANPGNVTLDIMEPGNHTNERISEINIGSVERSKVFAGRSEALVRSLM